MASSCTGGASFRISGFELGAFDGCYSASAVSTFNFLPIFYNTADSMPADGPTVYASDLFGTLSDEYVFAIGRYDERRDVVDRRCFDAAGTSAAATHPSEVTTWDCGDLASTFAITCGCSTPSPFASATPAPTDSAAPAPLDEQTPAPSAAATTPLPSPAPLFEVGTRGPSDPVTPVPTIAATVRKAGTPSPTTAGAAAKTTPAPVVSASPLPIESPVAAAATAAPLELDAATPSPSASARAVSMPSPAPAAAARNSSFAPATVCSRTDSFRLDGFYVDSYDGCFSASAVSTFNFLPVFYIGGAPADGATVYASDLFGSLTDEYVWSIGNYNKSQDIVDARHCVDADGRDASTIHPSEVTAWTCEDSGTVESAAFTVTCGCSTPPPTPAPVAAPSPCSGVDSFRVSDFPYAYQVFDGCYSASDSSTFNFNPVYFMGGGVSGGPAVYASDLFGLLENEYVWSIGNYRRNSDDVNVRHCHDNSGANASTIHPSEVTDWDCGDLDSTAFSISCGCATPAPATTANPASTPSPDGARDINIASSAPIAAADLAEETLEGDPEGVPLVVAIITGLAIFVVMMIALSIAFEGLRKGIWMCFTCKRESTSDDTALSASGSASMLSTRGELDPPVAASGSTVNQ